MKSDKLNKIFQIMERGVWKMYIAKIANNGVKKFWTRDVGATIREKIMSEFYRSGDDTLNFDFTGVEIVDYSFASEVIAISVSRLAKELIGKHIILTGMNKPVEENVGIALEKAELCSLVVKADGRWKLIGKYSNALINTFQTITELKKTDTPALAEKLQTTIPVLNNRLKVLVNLGLVKKEESSAPSGGRQYIYYSIL